MKFASRFQTGLLGHGGSSSPATNAGLYTNLDLLPFQYTLTIRFESIIEHELLRNQSMAISLVTRAPKHTLHPAL